MTILRIKTPRVFAPLLQPARYKGVYGGRGSGKSHFMAEALIERALLIPGHRGVCIREVQKTLKESSKRLLEDKIQQMGLGTGQGFKVWNECIETPGDGILTFQGMTDSSAESIKSLEGYLTAWCEESQTMSARSLQLLRPTIRAPDSELWFSWNARRKSDPVDALLRSETPPTGTVCLLANWRDNPYFPAVLEQERLDCLANDPDQYGHIWEGEYAGLLVGAYYAKVLNEAKAQGRLGHVARDPLLPLQAFIDIGGTGARSDAFTLWIAQLVGREVRVLDYYEVQGQPLEAHLSWMRQGGYTPQNTRVYLPHDGVQHDKVYSVTYEGSFQDAGYDTTTVPNQGRGAALLRVAAGRRLFPSLWIDGKCAAGVDALGWYHEKRDEARQIGLGPKHDWSSHGADSFGLMAVVMEEQMKASQWAGDIDYSRIDRGRVR